MAGRGWRGKGFVGILAGAALAVACGGGAAPTATRPVAPAPSPTAARLAAPVATATPPPTAPPIAAVFTPTPPAAGKPRPYGKLVLAKTKEPDFLDPHRMRGGDEVEWARLVYDQLHARNVDGTVRPNLASSFEMSPDGKCWTFTARQGVKWHNGDPFSAEDIRWSWVRNLDPELQSTHAPAMVINYEGVQVLDDKRARICYAKPQVALLAVMERGFFVLPKKYITEGGRIVPSERADNASIGTGPFKFVNKVPGDRIVYTANEDYWGEGPYTKEVVSLAVPEPSTRLAMVETGAADLAERMTLQLAAVAEKKKDLKVLYIDVPRAGYVEMNMLIESPFKDLRVRQAMQLAIDQKAIVDALWSGRGRIAATQVAPGVMGYDPNVKPWPYDPERARKLLAEAGYPNGFDSELWTGTTDAMAPILVDMWGKIGVRVKIMTSTDTLKAAREKKVPLVKYGPWAEFAFDPAERLTRHFRSGSAYGKHAIPKLDELIDAQNGEVDVAKREGILKELFQLVHDELPEVMLPVEPIVRIMGPNVLEWPLVKNYDTLSNVQLAKMKR